MEQDTLRNKNIELLDGGSFDVLIIGDSIKEAAIFASLAARGLPVALVSPNDFMASPGLAVPGLVGATIGDVGVRTLQHTQDVATTKAKLLKSNPSGFAAMNYIAMTNEKKRTRLVGESLLQWGASKFVSDRPVVMGSKSIAEAEPALLADNVETGVEYSRLSFLDTEQHYGVNLISRSLSNASAACNYMSVVKTAHRKGKPWEITLVDELTQKQYLLSANVVIENQDCRKPVESSVAGDEAQETFDLLEVAMKPVRSITLLFERKVLPVENVVDCGNENRSLVVGPYRSMTMVTSSEIADQKLVAESESSQIKSVLAAISKRFRCEDGLNEDMVLRSRVDVREFGCQATNHPTMNDLQAKETLDVEVQEKLIRYRGGEASSFIPFSQRVAKLVGQLGVTMKPSRGTYFGEPLPAQRDYFFEVAAEVGLNSVPTGEPGQRTLAEIIWNRHWSKAFKVVGLLEENPELIAPIHPECSIIWAELPVFRDNDMITSLEDFLERRTDLGWMLDQEALFETVSAEQLAIALGVAQKKAVPLPA